MISDKELVLSRHPKASCFGPVVLHWPGTPDRSAFVVTLAPYLSAAYGAGETEALAWANAASRLRLLEGA